MEDKMNIIKKLMLLALSAIFLYALSITCFAATWSGYFGYNAHETEYYYEASEGSLTSNTTTGFTANLSKIGWQGVWGCQIFRTVNINKGGQYKISFDIKSSSVDKYVYIKFSERNVDNNAYSFWVKCPRGQTVSVNKTFTAQRTTGNLIFGLGGDFGDRLDSYDEDSSYRYSLFESQFGINRSKLKDLDTQPGNAASSTTISVSNFSLNTISEAPTTHVPIQPTVAPRPQNNSNYWSTSSSARKSVKKPARVKLRKIKVKMNRVTVSWKKAKNAAGYQVKVGSIIKNTKSRKVTISVYNKRKVTVKVRAYSKGKKKYGSWSKKKKVKVKYIKRKKKKTNYSYSGNNTSGNSSSTPVKNSIIKTLSYYGNVETDNVGTNYYLSTSYYDSDSGNIYNTIVRYYMNTGIIRIIYLDTHETMVYFDISNTNSSTYNITFYDDANGYYASGYLYKNNINNSNAVKFTSYNFNSSIVSSAQNLTAADVKIALLLFDKIMSDHGSSVRHQNIGFNF